MALRFAACFALVILAAATEPETWVHPAGLPAGHNGGFRERLVAPAAGKQPHILMILFDDYGWADAGWHRNYTAPGGTFVPHTDEVVTPNLNRLVTEGIELDRNYIYKYCSPTRSALQSGRNPFHVNPLNASPNIANHEDPVSGFAAIPRNMTGMATKLAAAGYKTHAFGKWDAGMATPDHTPRGRGYQTAMNYFHHDNDFWSMTVGSCPKGGPPPPPTSRHTCASPMHPPNYCLDSSPNLALPGNGSGWTATATACCAECHNNSACMGWAWGKSANGGGKPGTWSCHLKSHVNKHQNGNCTSGCLQNCTVKGGVPVVDLWMAGIDGAAEGPAHGFNNTCLRAGGQQNGGNANATCAPGRKQSAKGHDWHNGYEDSLFEQQALEAIAEHDVKDPMFMFFAPHIVHTPLQAPQSFIDKFDFMAATDKPSHNRQYYHSMVAFADAAVGNITKALKAKGMWEDTIIVFSTDNGGPIYNNGTAGANNYPLRGGKMNNWDGGIRGNGFISGGKLPPSRRGVKHQGMTTAWDWYATFSAFAGVDPTDHRAAAAGLPPIDSVDHSAMIMGTNLSHARLELPIGTEPRASTNAGAKPCGSYHPSSDRWSRRMNRALGRHGYPLMFQGGGPPPAANDTCTTLSGLIWDEGKAGLWKLLTGDVQQDMFTGPHYPNSSTDEVSNNFVGHCGSGCLFNLLDDPLEKHDFAHDAAHAARLQAMTARLNALAATAFNPDRGVVDPLACDKSMKPVSDGGYGDFWGWWIE